MLKQISIITLAIGCAACVSAFDTNDMDAKLKSQPMILFPETGEHKINGRPGFVIYMKPATAHKINAPNSQEFFDLLNAQLSIEDAQGRHRLCEHGYRIVDDYTYYFRKISAECN